MILLTVRGLSRQFDDEPLFKNVGFEVRPGERIGLVGPNGAGKTTLLRILAGRDDPDEGQVELHSSADLAMLEQEANFPPGRTPMDEAKSGLAELYDLQSQAAKLAENIASESDPRLSAQLQRRYERLQHELHRLNAYNIDYRVDEVLAGLGFSRDEFHRPLEQFSGGQQSRAQLARLLLCSPGVLLLDEPTNHLDIAATEWLEGYLTKSDQAMVLVSHDRYFLDRVTNRILELYNSTVTDYSGNFSAYWRQRDERLKVQRRTYEKQQEFISKTEDFIRRNKSGQKHAQAADREKKLSRFVQVEPPREILTPAMGFGEASRTGDWVIDAVNVGKSFGSPLFSGVTLRIERGARIGIFGPNGSGKTTLLRTLLGDLQPDAGTIRMGTGVRVGYYDQQLSSVDGHLDAIEAARPPNDPSITPGRIRNLLARFGLRGEMVFQKVELMSGGERSKVALARIAAKNVNLLALDEPTNHLDLWARDSLEDALKAFQGTLLFVSHDRYFLDRVAKSVIVLEPSGWRFYEGNYSECVQFVKNQALQTDQKLENVQIPGKKADEPPNLSGNRRESSHKPTRRKRRFPYRKVDDLEAEIAENEELVEQLQKHLADPQIYRDGERVKETRQAFEETQARLDELYEHWEEAVELN